MVANTEEFGRYRLVKSLGAGGMAEVFLAKLEGIEGFERKLAIKRILPHHSKNEGFIEMFKDEARLVSRLSHPNIVQTFEFGKVGDCYYLSMEYVDGVSLADIMTYHKRRKLVVPLPALVEIGIQICRGIDYAHRETDDDGQPLGIIHRDLTPHNILVSRKGLVKITDFGIAKASMNTHMTQAGMIKGKVPYMSPEQAMGLKLTHVSDIFSIGIVLYEMSCLERLFQGDNDFVTLQRVQEAVIPSIKEKRPDMPDALEAAILKALARDREKRYQWASELEADLTRIKFELGQSFQSFDLATFVEKVYRARQANSEIARNAGTPPPEAPVGESAEVRESLSEIAAGLDAVNVGFGVEVEGGGTEEDRETVLLSPTVSPRSEEPAEEGQAETVVSEPSIEPPSVEAEDTVGSGEVTRPRVRRRWLIAVGVLIGLVAVGAFGYWGWSATHGSIVVVVDPEDAEVFFNGVKAPGRSPFAMTGLRSGEQVAISVRKEGYVPFERSLEVEGGVRKRLPVQLVHETRSLEIDTMPSGAVVYLGGHKTDWRTPCRLELPTGSTYDLGLAKEGYRTFRQTITRETLEKGSIAVNLEPVVPSASSKPGR